MSVYVRLFACAEVIFMFAVLLYIVRTYCYYIINYHDFSMKLPVVCIN